MIRRAVASPPFLVGAAACGCAVVVAAGLRGDAVPGFMIIALPCVAFLAGRAPARIAGAVALALLVGAVAAGQALAYDDDNIVPEIMLPLALYLAGLALSGREALAARLTAQATELEAERDAYAQLSVRYERARIAAELHDVVAHAISVMVVQASAGQRLAVSDPARALDTFGVIRTAARQAEADLGRLAALLAQDAPGETPRGDLGLVVEIVDSARASGLPVTLRLTGDTADIPGAAAHAAVRVVQEGLTNALRYAPGAPIEVSVDTRPGTLELVVANGLPATPPRTGLGLGSGRGLTGLRERVDACGGTLDAGPDVAGGWSLRAWIAC
jgi:signal transduction histidine kinase